MKKFVVYRVFSKKERPEKNRYVYYGWSSSKSVIKAFLKQRNPKKYDILKIDTDEVGSITEDIDDDGCMIDYIKIRSAKTDEEICLFLTRNELKECEIFIQQMFIDQASLSNIDGDGNYVNMFLALDKYYADALFLIGYKPKEVDILFPSADYHDDYSSYLTMEEILDEAYDSLYDNPYEEVKHVPMNIPGLGASLDISNKLYYSFESFIKALKDNL